MSTPEKMAKLAQMAEEISRGTFPTKAAFSNIKELGNGRFEGESNGFAFSACYNLFLIRKAWERGCTDMERLADGFGPGMGTQGDWSAIRDSSDEAITAMLEAALNFLFPEGM